MAQRLAEVELCNFNLARLFVVDALDVLLCRSQGPHKDPTHGPHARTPQAATQDAGLLAMTVALGKLDMLDCGRGVIETDLKS